LTRSLQHVDSTTVVVLLARERWDYVDTCRVGGLILKQAKRRITCETPDG